MTEYDGWKVVDLKAELKRRKIPSTGLRLKQNIIDKLLESDSASQFAQQPAPTPPTADDAQKYSLRQEMQTVPDTEMVDLSAHSSAAAQETDDTERRSNMPQALTTENEPEKPPKPVAEIQSPVVEIGKQPLGIAQQLVEAAQQPVDPTEDLVGLTQHPAESTEQPAEAVGQPQTLEGPDKVAEPSAKTTSQSTEVVEPTENVPDRASRVPAEAPVEPDAAVKDNSSEKNQPEIIDEDTRKRKRRSQSPPPSPETLKRIKAANGTSRSVKGGLDEKRRNSETVNTEVSIKPVVHETSELTMASPDAADAGQRAFNDGVLADERHSFHSKSQEGLEQKERTVYPARHPATKSLYIRDLKRPLQSIALKNHLISIATPPESSPNRDVVVDFFVDSIKTHSFVTFANVSAAARARAALHNSTWPDERMRDPLWVDFIPEEKVQEWKKTEEQAGRSGPRWEVVYTETDDGLETQLQPIPGSSTEVNSHGSQNTLPPPPAPKGYYRHSDRHYLPPSNSHLSPPVQQSASGFQALDDRFRFTITKPKLYYTTAPRDVVNHRLDKFDDLAQMEDHPRPSGDEMRRYTFDAATSWVDAGPEYRVRGPSRGGMRGGRGRREGRWDYYGWRGR